MLSPIGYLDYRHWLRDLYEERRRIDSYFSYRYMAGKIGISHSFLVRVLQGEKHLAETSVDGIVQFLKLEAKEDEYFRVLVRFGRTPSESERQACLERLALLQGMKLSPLDLEKVDYFRGWLPAALRSLIDLAPFATPVQLKACFRPSVRIEEIQEGLEVLERLGLLHRSENDRRWHLREAFVEPGPGIGRVAVRDHQRSILRLAMDALEDVPPAERYVATATFTLDPEDLPEAQIRIRALRDSLLRLSSEGKRPSQVVTLALALVPLAQAPESRTAGTP